MADAEPTIPPPQPGTLSRSLERNIAVLTERRRREAAAATWQERMAQAITGFTGSMLFVWLHLLAYSAWVLLNLGVIPWLKPFDPSLVYLATEASVEAIFLSTFVLISQNRSTAAADKRADLDLYINLLTEHELTRLAAVIGAIAERLGIPVEIDEVQKDVAPEAVLDAISARN